MGSCEIVSGSEPMRIGEPLPTELEAAVVIDRAGNGAPFANHLRGSPCFVSFLRHFGCIGCAEHIADIAPRLLELHELGIRTVFVGNGEPRYIDGFLERTGLVGSHALVVTDPTLKVFTAAGLVRSKWRTYGPRAIADAARAWSHGIGWHGLEGDHFQQGGALVTSAAGTVAYFHQSVSLGDHPSANDIVDVALTMCATRSAVST
jgi:hypothetical protein